LANAAEVRERVSKEGAIQLMFDAKFLCDALAAGASPPHAADPDLAKAVLAESATSNSATGGDLAEPSAIKDRIKAIHIQLQTLVRTRHTRHRTRPHAHDRTHGTHEAHLAVSLVVFSWIRSTGRFMGRT
jgi:hypothetical protein